MNLNRKLSFTAFVTLIFFGLFILTVIYFRFTADQIAEHESLFLDKTEVLSERYDDWWDKYRRQGESYARIVEYFDGDIPKIAAWIGNEMQAIMSRDSLIENLFLEDENEIEYSDDGSTHDLTEINAFLSDQMNMDIMEEYKKCDFLATCPLVSPVTEKPIIVLLFPVHLSGDRMRIIGLTVYLDHLLDLTKSSLSGNAYASIVADNGLILAHPDTSLIMNTTLQDLGTLKGSEGLAKLAEHILAGETGFGRYSFKGVKKLMSYTTIRSTGWKLMVTDDMSVIENSVRKQAEAIALTFLEAMATVMIIIWPITYKSTGSIRLFYRELQNVLGDSSTAGDLTRRIPVVSRDEMGKTAEYFNRFAGGLQDILVLADREVSMLGDSGQTLAANMEETAASITQINSNLGSIDKKMEQFYANLRNSGSMVDDISSNIERAASQIEVQSGEIGDASSAVEEMIANLNSITDNIEKLGEIVDRLDANSELGQEKLKGMISSISQISEKSVKLSETNNVIKNIAAQTNLLAMNAAIEAAHAGERGKGFAVVADEIRKLAEIAGMQSKEVSSVIKEIGIIIDAIVGNSTETEKALDDILEMVGLVSVMEKEVRSALQEQNSGSSQILESLSRMRAATIEVATGSEAIRLKGRDLSSQMFALNDFASSLEQGVKEVSMGTGEINNSVISVEELARRNKETIDNVTTALCKVKLY